MATNGGTATSDAAGSPTPVLVRVFLPDRPGALGLVASRIGALGGDIVGVDVLERGERVAIDEFAVILPQRELLGLLVREVEEVDGALVEQCREVASFPDPRLDALDTAEALLSCESLGALDAELVSRTTAEFNADWTAVLDRDATATATGGTGIPTAPMLAALAAGTAASPLVAEGVTGPDDLMVAPLRGRGAFLLVGRGGQPFRRRERRQLLALARIADLAGAPLDVNAP
jgi:hypothetical protein